MLNKKSKIFVAGHNGMVGSSIYTSLKKRGYKKIITIEKKTKVNKENFCLVLFFKKADLIAIIKSSLLSAIFLNIQSA